MSGGADSRRTNPNPEDPAIIHVDPSSARARPAAIAGVLLLLLAGCTPSTGSLGTLATPAQTAAPSVGLPSSDLTPAPATPATSGSGSPAPSAAPADTTVLRAYFLQAGATGGPHLVPVLREVPRTVAVATAAVQSLIAGPGSSAGTMPGSGALSTAIPAGTRLLGISITGGVATVDLSAEFASGGGTASVLGRLAQVVYTLTQFPTVEGVLFELDGGPVTAFGGGGIVLDHAVGRSDYVGQLPAIFVDRPAWGAALGMPGTVSGLANVFEARFRVRIVDAGGATLADQPVDATCGTGCWGTFSTGVPYAVTTPGWGTLRVYDLSAKDGSTQDVVEYPVWLG